MPVVGIDDDYERVRQRFSCLLPGFSLERKRFLLGIRASMVLAWATLVIMSLGRVPFSGVVFVFSFAAPLRMVE